MHVPAFRHRIEDLHKLIPYYSPASQSGTGPYSLRYRTLSPTAIRQLTKYICPGNVAQLREILQEVFHKQRSGAVEVDKLPPIYAGR